MSVYVLSKLITDNIIKADKKAFIQEQGLWSQFNRSPDHDYRAFFQDCINEGTITREDFSNFLFEHIFWGQERECFIYKIYRINYDISTRGNLLSIVKENYINIESLHYNRIMYANEDFELNDLVALNVKYNIKNELLRIRMVFAQTVNVILNKIAKKTISYITVEIDMNSKKMYIKVAPKTGVIDKDKMPDKLNAMYYAKISKMFDVSTNPYNNIHKETICNISKDLYNQVYEEMVTTKPKELDDYIKASSSGLIKLMNISNMEFKIAANNVFNVNDSLTKIVENILISDILYGIKEGEDLHNVDGVVTYLKFSDGKNISARLKGKNCRDPIFDSEAFMSLRSAIDNSQRIIRLEVMWLQNIERLRVTYDSSNLEFLNIHFYRNLTEQEFYYGLEKYEQYERNNRKPSKGISPMEATS
nr:hypothetical protein [uncultured Anaerosporobacter sp.]